MTIPDPVELDLDRYLRDQARAEAEAQAFAITRSVEVADQIRGLLLEIWALGYGVDAAALADELSHAEGSLPDCLRVLEDAEAFLETAQPAAVEVAA